MGHLYRSMRRSRTHQTPDSFGGCIIILFSQTSDIRHQTSDIRHQTSDIRHRYEQIVNPTSPPVHQSLGRNLHTVGGAAFGGGGAFPVPRGHSRERNPPVPLAVSTTSTSCLSFLKMAIRHGNGCPRCAKKNRLLVRSLFVSEVQRRSGEWPKTRFSKRGTPP